MATKSPARGEKIAFRGTVHLRVGFTQNQQMQPCAVQSHSTTRKSLFFKMPHIHNFVPGQAEYQTKCADRIFKIPGIMYCQQNGINKACAQVALRSLLSSVLPDQPIPYSTLNKIANTPTPNLGLDTGQIRKILNHFQITYTDLDYDTPSGSQLVNSVPYYRFIYGGMESGRGGLVGFSCPGQSSTARHIIPFFGHTFNQDTWAPRASNAYFKVGATTKYIPSDEWLSSFIGHDDNFGSNFCIPKKFISPEQVKYVLTLLPACIPGTPLIAEARGIDFLYNHLDQIETQSLWGNRWKNHITQQDTVVRPLLMSRKKYISHISHIEDWERNQENPETIANICKFLPEHFWMLELSLPELYSANYSKLGEVLLTFQPDTTKIELAVLRIPGQYAVKLPNQNRLYSFPSSFTSHAPLYTQEIGLLDFGQH